jgi:hypothetical protein
MQWLFTENETNNQRLFNSENASPYVKDAFHEWLIHNRQEAVNPNGTGTKAAAHYRLTVPAGGSGVVCLRLTKAADATAAPFGDAFDQLLSTRQQEADAFYELISPPSLSPDARRVMRQALGRHAVDQAVLLFRSGPLAGGTRSPSVTRGQTQQRPQSAVVPHGQ